jgi:hypothetical protein
LKRSRISQKILPSKDFYNTIELPHMPEQKGGSILLGIIAGFVVHLLLGGTIPVIGDLIAGFVAGYIAKGIGRGALAGFMAGALGGIILAIILPLLLIPLSKLFQFIAPFLGYIQAGAAILAIAFTIKGALIGLFGGIIGGAMSARR